MKKIFPALAVVLIASILSSVPCVASPQEDSFRKSFPGVKPDSITPTNVNGLYEVTVGNQVVYYAPGPEYLIYGPMVTSKGENLTQKKEIELLERKLKAAPLAEAIRIGSGSHQVIEITNIDCSYCRKASAYLDSRKDLTRHVFLLASPQGNSQAKTLHVLSATDRAKAYEEAMSGKLDDMKFTPRKTEAAEKLLQAHAAIGKQIGVTGTPLFLIDGQVVRGADMEKIEKILGGK